MSAPRLTVEARRISLSLSGGLIHRPGARVKLNLSVDPPGSKISHYKLLPLGLGVVKDETLYLSDRSFTKAYLQACSGQVCSERVSIRVVAEEGPLD